MGQCPHSSSEQVWAYGDYVQSLLTGTLTAEVLKGPKNGTDGLFSPACLAHGLAFSGPAAPKVQGLQHYEALGNWYFRRAGARLLLNNSTDPDTLLACSDATKGRGAATVEAA